jgi:endonuclease YncB( thermonuclease family)
VGTVSPLNFGQMGQSGVAQRLRCFVAALSFGVLLALVLALPASAETFDGRRAVIIDGDTLAIGTERIRLLNIDAPESFRSRCERELVMGLKAKERLAALARSGPLEIERHGHDRYRRTLARVYAAKGRRLLAIA